AGGVGEIFDLVDVWRRHRVALVATFRRYGVSAWGIGTTVSWAEACDLLEAAMNDTSTELFSAVTGWKFPLSQYEILMLAGTFGKDAYKVMPFDPEGQVSDAEVAQAHEELLAEI